MKRYEYGLVMTTNAKVGGSSPSWRANKKVSHQRDFFIGKQKKKGLEPERARAKRRNVLWIFRQRAARADRKGRRRAADEKHPQKSLMARQ